MIESDDRGEAQNDKTWFRTIQGHRYGKEIALIVIIKLVALVLLWFVVIKPWPRPASPPSDVVRQLYTPSAPAKPHD